MLLAAVLCAALSCNKSEFKVEPSAKEMFRKGDIGFYVDNLGTKTSLAEDGTSIRWEGGDKLYLWARSQANGSLQLKKQEFNIFAGSSLSRAYFTATLAKAMPQGTYDYVACYPSPTIIDSTTVSFKLPEVQTGEFCDIDFMISDVCSSSQMKAMEKVEDYSNLRLNFSHKFHIFRFFIPQGHQGAEDGLVSFFFKTPVPVVGTYVTNLYNREEEDYISDTDASRTVEMNLKRPLFASNGAERQYAYAAVIPFDSKEDDKLLFHTDGINSKTSFNAVSLEGRSFKAGHMTSVAIKPVTTDSRDLKLTYTGNLCGEPVESLRLIGPEGLVWNESGSNILEIESAGDTLAFGSEFLRKYNISKELYNGGKVEIIAEMLSEHLANRNLITLTELENLHHEADIHAKELLNEDFSGVATFHSGDSGSGNNNTYAFLNGWTGSRIGAEEGKSIRIAGRRTWTYTLFGVIQSETLAPARADSAPLNAYLIKDCQLELSFTFGANNEGTKLVGQNFQVGYITTPAAQASGSNVGTYPYSQSIASNVKDGSFDSTPQTLTLTLDSLPVGEECLRISFKTTPMSDKTARSSNNTTTWIYIDNVSVKIKKEEGQE